MAYAELHCHSNFSFLDGASHPEELVAEAVRLGISALALTDHNGLYGAVRFAVAAGEAGLPAIYGAEITLAPAGLHSLSRGGTPDPPGRHLVILARDSGGYARLSRALSEANLASGRKGEPHHDLERLGALADGHLLVLTGCRKGSVTAALLASGPRAAGRELDHLVALFGRENVAVELFDHGDPLDSPRNDALAVIGASRGVDLVATNVVHYATPRGHRLAGVLAATRSRCSLDDLDGWLPGAGWAHLRSPAEQSLRFARYPGVVERAGELGLSCAFDLQLVAPRLPCFSLPTGESPITYLRHLVAERAPRRYGPRSSETVPGAWRQLEHELEVIDRLDFAGYFLIVFDLVELCRRRGIYCQGRGSAANSAVCYILGITNADAVSLGLLFERFLSLERDGPPDIDIDIESGRREEVIQYVYQRYGRERAAQVANVITYRPRSAVRDAGKALGYPEGQVDSWTRRLERWGSLGESRLTAKSETNEGRGACVERDLSRAVGVPDEVLVIAAELEGAPRHLGIHSGGMVICDRPVVEVCPVEWASMPGRTVLQWDKLDCATAGFVKFDLLGLGMLEVLHRCVDLIAEHEGVEVDLAAIPQEPAVYEMLARADTVGVFQVESRAQMATLPRLKPACFYDLVVEVALIRPGPIQGGSVHPYLRRRNGQEPVTYLHPLLERSLAKTLGVPLFQEQLMQIAIDVAGFSAGEADQLRQAMGAKRSSARMERLRGRLYAGMAERGIRGDTADAIYQKLSAFASFGFPESHSISFAYLVYASAWLKLHHGAALLAGLLNSQPMGFWAPSTLVADARRHGVVVYGPDIEHSAVGASLERDESGADAPAVRLGLHSVRGIGPKLAERVVAGSPYVDLEDLALRSGATASQLEALATAGALRSISAGSVSRREALWAAAGAVEAVRPGRLPGFGALFGSDPPFLGPAGVVEEMTADLAALGFSLTAPPFLLLRKELSERGVLTAGELAECAGGERVLVAGVVTHRQRPATAKGTTFINLEDETGLVNVICSRGVWARYRIAARDAVALLVRGRLERADGAIAVAADRLEALLLP